MTAGADLKLIADQYANDIEATDEIVVDYLGGDETQKPSIIINGLINIDITRLKEQSDAFVDYPGRFDSLSAEAIDFTDLMDHWSGKSSDAFGDRWKSLSNYVGVG
ncbi:MAG: hypothetical protein ACRD6Q_05045, partial [Nitrososphaeraceae archaeon]